MAKRREKSEVVFDILNIISKNNNSIKSTPLLRYSNLNYNLFKEYIKELKEKDLIVENNKKNKEYSLSEKGFKYLEKYRKVHEFLDEFLL
jgi:predicted transcriptional regulator